MIDSIKERVQIEGESALIPMGINYDFDDYQEYIFLKNFLPKYEFYYEEDQAFIKTDKAYLNLLDKEMTVYPMHDHLFDYQKFFVEESLKRKKLMLALDCGLGKTSIEIEFANQVSKNGGKVLIICPLLVLFQFKLELEKFYPDLNATILRKTDFNEWIETESSIGIVNFEYFREIRDLSGITAVIVDESSIFKSEDTKYGNNIIKSTITANIQYRLACSATPAPNDYGELSNHSLFLGYTKTYKEFFADFFIKNPDNQSQWILRAHAENKFYHFLSKWSYLMRHPDLYNFKDNTKEIPSFELIKEELIITDEQRQAALNMENEDQLSLFPSMEKGGIVNRNKHAQISRGFIYGKNKEVTRIKSNKTGYTYQKVFSTHKNESILIWVQFAEEQHILERMFHGLGKESQFESISGETKEDDRIDIIKRFLNKETRILISKPSMLGLGLNFQHVSVQLFYGINFSFEQFYQAVRRSYRYGQTKHLKVYIPFTQLESKIIDNVFGKSEQWESLLEKQEQFYRRYFL